MVYSYFVVFVKSINTALLILNLFFVLSIIVYLLVKKKIVDIRLRNINNITSDLKDLSPHDKDLITNSCLNIVNQSAPFEFFHTVKNSANIMPEVLANQLKECIINSHKINEIERMALRSGNKWGRIEAIILLGFLKSDNTLDILRQGAHDKDNNVAYFSLLSLGRHRSKESAKILLEAIKTRAFNGQKIASIIEQFPPFIVDVLVESLDEKDPLLSFWSVKLLSRFKPKQYTKRIAQLINDTSADLRAAACECLGEIADVSAKDAVKESLKDTQWFVRMHAIRALEKILGAECIPDVAPLLRDKHWFVKENVKEVMAKHFGKAMSFVEKYIYDTDDREMVQSCIEIIDKSGYSKRILEDVNSDNKTIRENAQKWLDIMIKSGARFGLGGGLAIKPEVNL